jgi:hypothetical protein
MKKNLAILSFLVVCVATLPLIAYAQSTGLFDNPLESDSLLELFAKILRAIVRIAAIALVFAFVWVGFQFAAAQGNTESLSKARNALLWTVIGAAIILGAEGIAAVIGSTAATLAP